MSNDYPSKLRDPRWQKKKTLIFQRDDFMCLDCRDKGKPVWVFHVFQQRDKDPWDYPDNSYVTLCRECHAKRKPVLDSICNSIRLALGSVPLKNLSDVSARLIAQTVNGNGGSHD